MHEIALGPERCDGGGGEAKRRLAEALTLLRTPSGYGRQSPSLAVANKQQGLVARYIAELRLTPAARVRVPMKDSRPADGEDATDRTE